MDISVVVLTLNEEHNIAECLESILRQRYDRGRWEVIVVDGGSTDQTLSIVERYRQGDDRVRIARNTKTQIAPGRNVGLRESTYPFVAFTDADCTVPDGWLEGLQQAWVDLAREEAGLAGVGGGNVPPDAPSGGFLDALGIYLDSFLGAFNSPQGRNFGKPTMVDSLACLNVLYRKQSVLAVSGFDEAMGNIAEDLDLNLRLKAAGHRLYFVPNLAVHHKLRPTLRDWLRNMAIYGDGRAKVTCKHRMYCSPFFVLPTLFLGSMMLVRSVSPVPSSCCRWPISRQLPRTRFGSQCGRNARRCSGGRSPSSSVRTSRTRHICCVRPCDFGFAHGESGTQLMDDR